MRKPSAYSDEVARLPRGLRLLETDDRVRRAFALANRAFDASRTSIRHTRWRPFQLGFVLANLASIVDASPDGERHVVDTLWFATGGGKTETYLLYVLTAAFHDRLRGKREGITSWGRFPLRMLSLQQTQRFADVLAAAELVRRDEKIRGAFSLGFFVGNNGTPNRIPTQPSRARTGLPTDPDMPSRYQVLLRCPFCGSDELEMRFDPTRWALDHVCTAPRAAPGAGRPLPLRIVDEEIYRSLPTVVLGTLDKAANISMQAAMRGFYGPPAGRCSVRDPRLHLRAEEPDTRRAASSPAALRRPGPLAQDATLYAPTVRMQDELHLLRDSLGAVDAHYEALLDELQPHYGSHAEDHRLLRHARRSRRTSRGPVPPGRADLPAPGPARRPLVVVPRHR